MKNKTIKISSSDLDIGERLDVFLSKKLNEFTRSNIKKMINSKRVKINNVLIVSQSRKIKAGDTVSLTFKIEKNEKIQPSKKKIKIIYEDQDLIIVNKPQGMVVHPGAGNKNDTLVNILLGSYGQKLSNIGDPARPGIVHRIDKDTSGLLVIAKNNLAHAFLSKQFSDHSIERKYTALVWGVLRPLKGNIETFITRSKKNRQLMTTDDHRGKKAITNYTTLKVYNKKNVPKISLVEFELKTGRTHQIRVHMIFKGTSILGDKKYKKRNNRFKKIDKKFIEIMNSFDGQILHASSLGFIHPRSTKKLEFSTKFPSKFKKIVDFLDNLQN